MRRAAAVRRACEEGSLKERAATPYPHRASADDRKPAAARSHSSSSGAGAAAAPKAAPPPDPSLLCDEKYASPASGARAMGPPPKSPSECAICLQGESPTNGKLCDLPCGHQFHMACVLEMSPARDPSGAFTATFLCPLCRGPFRKTPLLTALDREIVPRHCAPTGAPRRVNPVRLDEDEDEVSDGDGFGEYSDESNILDDSNEDDSEHTADEEGPFIFFLLTRARAHVELKYLCRTRLTPSDPDIVGTMCSEKHAQDINIFNFY